MRIALTRNGDLPIRRKVCRSLLDEARGAHPCECCGLLLGRFGKIWTIRPTRNVHPSPETHFEIDPQSLIDAHRAERAGGLALLGYYHSHPSGDLHPSITDRAQAAGDGRLWAIVDANHAMFWRDTRDGFEAMSYQLLRQ
ncbi:MAG: M67 family metallopeptidase [Pseudomonadota bacterium]|nr:M67 family metallopeptidase [Pseudomonadota bacterium]